MHNVLDRTGQSSRVHVLSVDLSDLVRRRTEVSRWGGAYSAIHCKFSSCYVWRLRSYMQKGYSGFYMMFFCWGRGQSVWVYHNLCPPHIHSQPGDGVLFIGPGWIISMLPGLCLDGWDAVRRNDWPGLCLFCCYQPSCVVNRQGWFWAFLFY